MSDPSADASAFPPPAVQPAPERPPRPAATIVVVRDGASGIEVLLSRRADGTDYTSGRWVFPGGIVDPRDRDAHPACYGIDDAEASARLGLDAGGLDFFVAAIRESFEESGLLFGRAVGDNDDVLDGEAADRLAPVARPAAPARARHRRDVREEGIRLDAGRARLPEPLAHAARPAKRYDTRFFIGAMPASQVALFDGTEMVEQLWIAPAEALARSKTLKLLTPTQKTLELVSRFADVAALMAWAREPRRVPLTMPHVAVGSQGPRPVMPDEPAYAELGRIDPAGPRPRLVRHRSRPAGAALRAGDPRHRRTTAASMTGPGTNTYLVGGGPATNGRRSTRGPRSTRTSRRSSPPRRDRSRASSRRTRTPTIRRRRCAQGAHRARRARPRGAAIANGRTRASFPTSRSAAASGSSSCRARRCARSTRPAMRRTTSATCSRKRRRSSPATT
jgi:8-oxo-dGTP pyrophosphatase MutT (NUDIX family)